MNDPWDVKSVRQAGQYISCMKINGVPLLPPVLSKECRKEMQYYKLLAKEVEKRILHLKPYIDSDTDSNEDKTDAPELPECEHIYDPPVQEPEYNVKINNISAVTNEILHHKSSDSPDSYFLSNDYYKKVAISNASVISPITSSPKKIVIDLSLSINETSTNALPIKSPEASPPIDLPERDYNCIEKITQKDLLTDLNSSKSNKPRKIAADSINFDVNKDVLSDPFPDLSINQDGPSSLSSKSFTGSLLDIYTESMKESQMAPKLIRQRSYTLLKPSPQLLAHLEVQSLNTGVEMSCISMSDSLSNLNSPSKKRRSWDLESAKMKWSTMALELNQKNMTKVQKSNSVSKNNLKLTPKKLQTSSPPRSKSVLQDKSRRPAGMTKVLPKSEPVQKPVQKAVSPIKNAAVSRAVTKEPITKTTTPKKESAIPVSQLISESDDPALRVRELYEKIQKQQLAQMASLVEKQKREQLLLQQVFEEQNNLLYKQLKTICPKSPIEVRQAWGEKHNEGVERGPVSLSQLINHKPQTQCGYDSPVSDTLTETNNYIIHCDDILKRSKDITGSLKKQHSSRVQNGHQTGSPQLNLEGTKTRTHSPSNRSISRRLNYDTSASSEREYEPIIMTDRTNDTMADLNVTFPTDQSDDGQSFNHNNTVINQLYDKQVTVVHRNPAEASSRHNSATSGREDTNPNMPSQMQILHNTKLASQPTPEQRSAASRIVGYARGYLVRRLMRTARVQATVQTLQDALLCALQLHRDRDGIRGADVDLHRRLIQQITAACYSLHDTFITSTPAERCAMIAADRARRRSLALRQHRQDIMSQSHSGVFPTGAKRPSSASLMTQSNYETFSGEKHPPSSSRRYMPSPRRRPWR